jgi:hypothetical protein
VARGVFAEREADEGHAIRSHTSCDRAIEKLELLLVEFEGDDVL